MKIELSKTSHNETALVVFSTSAKKGTENSVKIGHANASKALAAALADKSIGGKAQETLIFREKSVGAHRHLVVVGLGSDYDAETVRQSAAGICSAIKDLKISSACIAFDGLAGGKKDLICNLQALVEGLLLSNYSFDELKTKSKEKKPAELVVHVTTKLASDAAAKKAAVDAHAIAESVNFSRRLGDLPGNLMTPSLLAEAAVDAAKGTGVKVTIWDKARIKKERMGGLLGVAQGSDQEPRFIIMEYKGAVASKKPVVFVGKGLTFDCGGISIKPSAAMEEMKYDMCGGANTIGTILAIAKLKLKLNVIALVPATENLVNGSATKPGDVHVARNGKSFEVNNTDAEGRLILADALAYASELEPQVIIDSATLTGAIVMALGNIHTGYFTRNAALKKKLEQAAAQSGEWVWNMPLTDHHVKDMKGTYADLSNTSSSKGAGSATAAGFLEQFVGEGIPWVHVDIAGTAWSTGNRVPYNSKKGASGVMIRTYVELAKQYV
jgi:leucyl aminopeptidase